MAREPAPRHTFLANWSVGSTPDQVRLDTGIVEIVCIRRFPFGTPVQTLELTALDWCGTIEYLETERDERLPDERNGVNCSDRESNLGRCLERRNANQ